ncbi:MAG: oligopeptide transporter, OPT family [Clostridia bacterium]|nr:oligopeptide transporter, OPT family [Clostridia bacterium]
MSKKQNHNYGLTKSSVITGIILAVVFGAANAYLGLRVGMTVSASIPAAVISMGIMRFVLKRSSIVESNMVQTIGSAGESVAAGAIFTLPALFLWAAEGRMENPKPVEITLVALIGGLLGVFFMVPLRNALIVKEDGKLPYPEGKACAEVLRAGEKNGSGTKTVFSGMGISALFKFIIDGLKLAQGELTLTLKNYAGAIGTQIYPAVLSVGFICGPKISSYMFAGGILSWLALIPMIVNFGGSQVLYPAADTVDSIYALSGASGIWSSYIRYIGAGALAAGGIISLISSLPLMIQTFSSSLKGLGTKDKEENLSMYTVLISVVLLTLVIWLAPTLPVSFTGACIVVIFGFFFATVSSRMVGLVGSSNNPVSGMAIATLILATLILKLTAGENGPALMRSAIAIGSVICIIAAVSGDTSQDLKTGYIIGATPKYQQIGEIIGVLASSLAIGATLYLLNAAFGFGTDALAAPQATLMKLLVEGVSEGTLPWNLLLIGVFIAVSAKIAGLPVLPLAIGIYLPVHLNACIMAGGLVRLCFDRKKDKDAVSRGILFSSGMIAGEGLAGILLALFAVLGIDRLFDLSRFTAGIFSTLISIVLFLGLILLLFRFSNGKNREKNKE